MLCENCKKLAALPIKKICMKCRGFITINISCICDNCSNSEKVCSVCLKKVFSIQEKNKKHYKGSCKSCGGG